MVEVSVRRTREVHVMHYGCTQINALNKDILGESLYNCFGPALRVIMKFRKTGGENIISP